MSYKAFHLPRAFPNSLQGSVVGLASILDRPISYQSTFSVKVQGETLVIPYRIYDDLSFGDLTRLSSLQREMLHCLMTRHHSGTLRREYLARIVCLQEAWIPPFVVQLTGEYVIEILEVINKSLCSLDAQLYRRFLIDNEAFFIETKQRVQSYWDCYYRAYRKENYAGFQITDYFDRLLAEGGTK